MSTESRLLAQIAELREEVKYLRRLTNVFTRWWDRLIPSRLINWIMSLLRFDAMAPILFCSAVLLVVAVGFRGCIKAEGSEGIPAEYCETLPSDDEYWICWKDVNGGPNKQQHDPREY